MPVPQGYRRLRPLAHDDDVRGEGSTDRVSADLVVEGDFLSIVYGKPYNTTAKFKRCGAG